jgi:hypothetical protein
MYYQYKYRRNKMERNFNFEEIKKEKTKSNVIALGETAHKHVINDMQNSECFKSLEDDCLLLRILEKPAIITHEEHHAVELIPMNYRRRFVQEFDHMKEEARKVQD